MAPVRIANRELIDSPRDMHRNSFLFRKFFENLRNIIEHLPRLWNYSNEKGQLFFQAGLNFISCQPHKIVKNALAKFRRLLNLEFDGNLAVLRHIAVTDIRKRSALSEPFRRRVQVFDSEGLTRFQTSCGNHLLSAEFLLPGDADDANILC